MNEDAVGVVRKRLLLGVALTLLLMLTSLAVNYHAVSTVESLIKGGVPLSVEPVRQGGPGVPDDVSALFAMNLRKVKMLTLAVSASGLLVLVLVWAMIIRAVTASLKQSGANGMDSSAR